jgi:hypothetical protein
MGAGAQSFLQKEDQRAGHLQGDLQAMFDALYEIGIIEPVLKMDWKPYLKEIEDGSARLLSAIRTVNRWVHSPEELKSELGRLDEMALRYLAITVAKEYADFHQRETSIH